MSQRIVILTGGVGGSKLVLGACQIMPPECVTAIVNTGDDFRQLGLFISPDLDTLLYTLSGRAEPDRGWGRADESWFFMEALRSLGGEDWFQLGDADLALHILRTAKLEEGVPLSRITAEFGAKWGIRTVMIPMSDERVATKIDTDEGELSFQNYFVQRRCEPKVKSISFDGAEKAAPAPGATEAILSADVVLIAPSNPFLSIDPILAVSGIAEALKATAAPVVAVSPIVAGRAVKGPTAKLMTELGLNVTPQAIADHYAGIVDAMLVDARDPVPNLPHSITDTLMQTLSDRARVAEAALVLAARFPPRRRDAANVAR